MCTHHKKCEHCGKDNRLIASSPMNLGQESLYESCSCEKAVAALKEGYMREEEASFSYCPVIKRRGVRAIIRDFILRPEAWEDKIERQWKFKRWKQKKLFFVESLISTVIYTVFFLTVFICSVYIIHLFLG